MKQNMTINDSIGAITYSSTVLVDMALPTTCIFFYLYQEDKQFDLILSQRFPMNKNHESGTRKNLKRKAVNIYPGSLLI